MLKESPNSIRKDISEIIERRLFYQQCEEIKNILEPMKKAIVLLEFRNTSLVDCFIQLIRMVAAIKKDLPDSSNQQFRDECMNIFNRRWKQFDFNIYLLAYFFHPQFCGKY
jgi:hypothetical protein